MLCRLSLALLFLEAACCYRYLYLLDILWKRKYLMNEFWLVVTVRSHSSLFQKKNYHKSSLDCSGDGYGWIFFWTTVEVEHLDLDIADDIANILAWLPELYASRPRSEQWPVMFFNSHFGNPKGFNFRIEWFVVFLFAYNSANGDFFHSAERCVYCVDSHGSSFIPNIS